MASIGILGGTFNPPHLGHLALARHAREELGLDRVVLMPANVSPFKAGAPDPGAAHRLAMAALAAQAQEGVSACALELQRPAPSYTADTLEELHARYPEAELTFIVGADTARTLPSWHEPATVLRLAQLAVAERGGTDRDQVRDAIARASGERADAPRAAPTARFLAMEPLDVSSSLVRRRAAAGEPLAPLVGAAVAGYIEEHRLYRGEEG
ncbi:MAG: nicotinate (nicotinamide) nucleotide adenylyltransferase [Solirubrobacteraceae bacterium]